MFSLNIVTAIALASLLSTTEAVPVVHPIDKRAIGATLRPTNQPETCIGVVALSNGASLSSRPCNEASFYNKWDVSPGDNQVVKLSGLPAGSGDWCLDAGLDFTSGRITGLKIWQCFPGVPQQRWFYTDDKHLAVVGGNACLSQGRNGIITQGCFDSDATGGNPSLQTFNIVDGSTPPPPTPPTPPPSNVGRQIKWVEDGVERCLQVNNGGLANGQSVGINVCFTENLAYYPFQQWVYNLGSTKICVAPSNLTTTQYCLDFGTNLGSNGQGLKIWESLDIPAQRLYITTDNHIAVENGPGQCADVQAESGPEPVKPYGIRKRVQSWQCAGGNSNQIFKFAT